MLKRQLHDSVCKEIIQSSNCERLHIPEFVVYDVYGLLHTVFPLIEAGSLIEAGV